MVKIVSCDNILKIIKNLDLNKVHGHDMISIWKIKIFNVANLFDQARSYFANKKFTTE